MHALKRLKSANRFINLYSSAANSRRLLPPPAAAAKIGRIKRRKKVRQPLKNVVRLTCESAAEGGVCDVYVIGSVHDCPVSNVLVIEIAALLRYDLFSHSFSEIMGGSQGCDTIRETRGALLCFFI